MDFRIAVVGVDGMTCTSCSSTVERALKNQKGVRSATVSLTTNAATVDYDANVISPDQIVKEIENVGFDAKVLSNKGQQAIPKSSLTLKADLLNDLVLGIDGMTCTSCSSTVEKALKNTSGITNAVVSLTTNTANITYNPSIISAAGIADTIDSVGFDAKVLSDTKQHNIKRVSSRNASSRRTAVIGVEGMTCTSCTSTVEKTLNRMTGVVVRSVNLSTNTATVDYDSRVAGNSAVAFADEIESVGFEAKVFSDGPSSLSSASRDSVQDSVSFSFSSDFDDLDEEEDEAEEDSNHIKTILLTISSDNEQPTDSETVTTEKLNILRDALLAQSVASDSSIASIDVVASDCQLRICFDELLTGPRDFVHAAERLGLSVQVSSFGGFMMATRLLARQELESREYLHAVLWSVALTVPIVVLAMVLPMNEASNKLISVEILPGLTYCGLLLLALTTPVEFVIGYRFHKKALQSLRSRTMGMDFMISTGSLAAYMCSVLGMIRGLSTGQTSSMDTSYFDTSAVLITAVLLGKYLETYARGQTASAIHKLTAMKAKTARLVGTMPMSVYSADDVEGGLLNTYLPLTAPSPLQSNKSQPISTTDNSTNPLQPASYQSPLDSSERLIDSSLLHKYDVIRLVAGEAVPADGELLAGGQIGVDESMMTGESAMVAKKFRDSVFGGTTVVEGSALMRVTALGDDSTLGKILSTVQEAQTSKPPIQEFADKIALLFVPTVATISVLTFVVWILAYQMGFVPKQWYAKDGSAYMMSFLFALAVWVSACPCAFGLATPTAVLVATGIAAKHGVLVRRGASLQYAAEVDTVAFDKTGTLTRGCTELSDFQYISLHDKTTANTADQTVIRLPHFSSTDGQLDDTYSIQNVLTSTEQHVDLLYVLRLLLAAEVRSSHPLAKGITIYCQQALASMTNAIYVPKRTAPTTPGDKHHVPPESELTFDVVPGQGVHMFAADLSVLVGSPALLKSRDIAVPPFAVDLAKSYRAGGKVAVYMAVDGVLRAVMGVSDAVRPEAVFMIAALKRRGLRCYMVTGDEPTTARAIGATVGIAPEDILASAKPEDKEMFIAALQARGARVAFVGDGTNDSPALARANVGLTMASGSDIAVEAGDMVLCKNDLIALVTALDLSRHTLTRIKLNYLWAFGYNVLLIPIASGVLFPYFHFALKPMFAGAAMAVSSVSIVVSSLLLLLYVPPVIDIHPRSGKTAGIASSGLQEDVVVECNCPASTAPVLVGDGGGAESILSKMARKVSRGGHTAFSRLSSRDEDDEDEDSSGAVEMLTRYKASHQQGISAKKFDKKGSRSSLNQKSRQSSSGRRTASVDTALMASGCGCGKGNCKCGDACRCGVPPVTSYGALSAQSGDMNV